jgi:pimeloyl-ACP methyl ester carboxylesterase
VLTILLSSSFFAEAAKSKTKNKNQGLIIADRSEYVPTANNRSLWVSSLTPGKSCAIIFAHGLFESSQVWFNQYINWLPDCSTVIFDLYGHGLSTGILPKRDDSLQIKDLQTVINWTKATKIILVGHNYGGVGIQQYVQRYPDDKKIMGMALVDTFAVNPNPFRTGGDQAVINLLAATVFKQQDIIDCQLALINPATPNDLPAGAWEIFAGSGLLANNKAANQIILTNVSFVNSKFTKPVEIIYGTNDAIISTGNWEEMKKIYKNSKLSPLQGGGHSPHVQMPLQFNAALASYLKRVAKTLS